MFVYILLISCLSQVDCTLDLIANVYYTIYLTGEGAIINKTSDSSNDETVFTTTTITDGTVDLDIEVKFNSDNRKPEISIGRASQIIYNLNLAIRSADESNQDLYITFTKEWLTYNTIEFNFKSDINLLYDDCNNVFVKGFSLDGTTLLTQIFPLSQRDSCTICYYNNQCTSLYNVQPNETYITIANADILYNIYYFYQNLPKIKFLLTDTSKLEKKPYVSWIDFVFEKSNIEFIGLNKEVPSQFDIKTIFSDFKFNNVTIDNVEFINTGDESFSADHVFVKNTENIIFDTSCSFTNTHEYRINNNESPFSKRHLIIEYAFNDISPLFESNKELILTVNTDNITVTNTNNEQITHITFVGYNDNIINIIGLKDQNKKITIKPASELKDMKFTLKIEDCNSIEVDFNGWNTPNSENSYTRVFLMSQNANDISISRTDSDYVEYVHWDFNKLIFDWHVIGSKSIMLCLGSESCSHPAFLDVDSLTYNIPVPGDDFDTVINQAFELIKKHTQIYLYFSINTKFNGSTFDFTDKLDGMSEKLSITFHNDDDSAPLTININSMPDIAMMAISNCHINSQTNFVIKDGIMYVNDGLLTGDYTCEYMMRMFFIDLTYKEEIFSVYENEYEFKGARFPANEDFTIYVISKSLNYPIVFDTKVTNPCQININIMQSVIFGGTQGTLSITITDNWSNLPDGKNGNIKIFSSFENVVYRSKFSKVYIEAYYKLDYEEYTKLLFKIQPISSHNKVLLCYKYEKCRDLYVNGIEEDEIFFTSRTEEEFQAVIDTIKLNSDIHYKYFKYLVFSDYDISLISIDVQLIPLNRIDQIKIEGDSNYFTISSKDVKNIKSLSIQDAYLFIDNTLTDTFEFNEIVSNDISNLFSFGIPTLEPNIKINVLKLQDIKESNYEKLNSFYSYINYVVLELITDLENNDYAVYYKDNNIYVNVSPDNYSSYYASLPNVNGNNTYLLVHDGSPTLKQNLILIRGDDTITHSNIIIDKGITNIPIKFTCEAEVTAKFTLNVYVSDDVSDDINVQIDKGECNDIDHTTIPVQFETIESSSEIEETSSIYTEETFDSSSDDQEFSSVDSNNEKEEDKESSSVESNNEKEEDKESSSVESNNEKEEDKESSAVESEKENTKESVSEEIILPPTDEIEDPPVSNTESSSPTFELTNQGYKYKEEDENQENEREISNTEQVIYTVTFTQQSITIKESGQLSLQNALYFVASQESASINIDKGVTKSNIGVSSEKNPTINLAKSDNPVSIMNNITQGKITINPPEPSENSEKVTQLDFKEIVNYRGNLVLNIQQPVTVASFQKLLMSRISAISTLSSQENLKVLNDNQSPRIQIKESVEISPSSDATISRTDILGSLSTYDNSVLTLQEETKFDTNSNVKVFIQSSKTYSDNDKPLIDFKGSLDPIPSSITLSSKGEINIVNLPLIAASKFNKCDDLKISFDDGIEGKITHNCKVIDGKKIVYITVNTEDNDKKDPHNKNNKLGASAIAGIVIACVVVVAAIIGLIIYFIKSKKKEDSESEIEVSEIVI